MDLFLNKLSGPFQNWQTLSPESIVPTIPINSRPPRISCVRTISINRLTPKLFVPTTPINRQSPRSFGPTIPIYIQFPKSFVRTISICRLPLLHRIPLCGQFQLLINGMQNQLSRQFRLIQNLRNYYFRPCRRWAISPKINCPYISKSQYIRIMFRGTFCLWFT